MNDVSILPLNINTLMVYAKHFATLFSWIAIITAGIALYLRTRHKWWTLFSAGYSLELYRLIRDNVAEKTWPLPLQFGTFPEPLLIDTHSGMSTVLTEAPAYMTSIPVVGSFGYWHSTSIFVAIALIWALYRTSKISHEG